MNGTQKRTTSDDIPKVTFDQALSLLTISWNTRRPMLLVGPPATAKSALVKAFCDFNGFDLIVTTAATAHPTDNKGLPANVDGHAEWLPYGDLRKALEADKPTVWLFDDLTNADGDVQKAYMQLFNERQVNEHKLSDHVHIIATGNRREDKSGVKSLIEAMKSRFASIVEILPNLDQYIKGYAIPAGFHQDVIGFLRFKPELLYVDNPTADMNRDPNLRMWEFLSDCLHEIDGGGYDNTKRLAIQSVCGVALGSEISAYIDIRQDIPDPEECLKDPVNCPLPDPNHISATFAFNAALARLATLNSFKDIIRIADRLPKVAAAKLVFDALAYCPEAETKCSEYALWCGRNKTSFIDN